MTTTVPEYPKDITLVAKACINTMQTMSPLGLMPSINPAWSRLPSENWVLFCRAAPAAQCMPLWHTVHQTGSSEAATADAALVDIGRSLRACLNQIVWSPVLKDEFESTHLRLKKIEALYQCEHLVDRSKFWQAISNPIIHLTDYIRFQYLWPLVQDDSIPLDHIADRAHRLVEEEVARRSRILTALSGHIIPPTFGLLNVNTLRAVVDRLPPSPVATPLAWQRHVENPHAAPITAEELADQERRRRAFVWLGTTPDRANEILGGILMDDAKLAAAYGQEFADNFCDPVRLLTAKSRSVISEIQAAARAVAAAEPTAD